MVVLRLTAHGQYQPQNSPHGWAQKAATYECNDVNWQYGCWTIVTPPWTDGSDYETGFTQNSEDLPPCCTTSTVRCYFPDDFLMVVDESHVAMPQAGGMYRGDRARKETLITHGFRLPSAIDNRPLKFDEFQGLLQQVLFVSATPGGL